MSDNNGFTGATRETASRRIEEVEIAPLESPATRERAKDSVRQRIAVWLTAAVIAIVVLPILLAALAPERAAAIKEVSAPILPAVLGIYGTIIGFYFGEKK